MHGIIKPEIPRSIRLRTTWLPEPEGYSHHVNDDDSGLLHTAIERPIIGPTIRNPSPLGGGGTCIHSVNHFRNIAQLSSKGPAFFQRVKNAVKGLTSKAIAGESWGPGGKVGTPRRGMHDGSDRSGLRPGSTSGYMSWAKQEIKPSHSGMEISLHSILLNFRGEHRRLAVPTRSVGAWYSRHVNRAAFDQLGLGRDGDSSNPSLQDSMLAPLAPTQQRPPFQSNQEGQEAQAWVGTAPTVLLPRPRYSTAYLVRRSY